jgi:predicted metal-dependent phosphoesterase TrpH
VPLSINWGSEQSSGFIDLHSHTNESDGTLTPAALATLAKNSGLDALAITDHDTFAGYEKALPVARGLGLDLLQAIELNSRFELDKDGDHRYVHLLAYFPNQPSNDFLHWLTTQQDDRRNRNARLVEALRARGIEITLAEVEAQGRSLAGRPHFARILVDKGYAKNHDDAFDRFIGEEAPSYVQRDSQTTEETIQIIRSGGGIPVAAHPIRLGLRRETEREVIGYMQQAGLMGLEVYHSEHSPELQAHYRQLAEELGLLPTGGSDFHGAVKPEVFLGTGRNGNIRVPAEFLERLRHADLLQ